MLQLLWIELRIRDNAEESVLYTTQSLHPKGVSRSLATRTTPNLSLAGDENQPDVKWKRTVHLELKRDYCSIMVFIWHLATLPQYRVRVLATVESALNRLPLPPPPSHSPIIPTKAVICFTLANCDSFSPIDKSWSLKILKLAVLRMEIEEALSWLSTLGGAFSSLGDRNVNFARKAGQISMNQLRLSYVFGDPNLIARCFIYMSHSLCQQGQRKKAIKFARRCLYPMLVRMGDKCERIVAQMYRSLRFRISFIYK